MKRSLLYLCLVFSAGLVFLSCSTKPLPMQTSDKIITQQTVDKPIFNPPGGNYAAFQKVTIICTTPDAVIHYTTDGTDPTEISAEYIAPIRITESTILKVRAFKRGWLAGQIATAYYIIELPEGMIYVSGSTFNPTDQSSVTLSPFYIGKYEVTQKEYRSIMMDNPAKGYGVGDSYPVYNVTWFNAIEYCNRRSLEESFTPVYTYGYYGTNPDNWPAGWDKNNDNHVLISCNWNADGYRLPTEMEWLFAAMGGEKSQGYRYSGSNSIDEVAWYDKNSDIGDGQGLRTHKVGSKKPNELGLYDMSGNVWEWCWDIWGSLDELDEHEVNPKGHTNGSDRVRRGGSWFGYASDCAVLNRTYSKPARKFFSNGFRVCRSAP